MRRQKTKAEMATAYLKRKAPKTAATKKKMSEAQRTFWAAAKQAALEMTAGAAL